MCPLSLNLDGSKKERIYGEEVGEDPDDVDEDAVVDKEVDLKFVEKNKMNMDFYEYFDEGAVCS